MDHKTDIERIIVRYLNDECNETDRQKLLLWIETSGENQEKFYQIKDVWDSLINKEDKTEAALLQFYKQQVTSSISSVKRLHLWKAVAGVAAVLAIGFISLFLLDTIRKSEIEQLPPALVSVKVPLGSRSEMNLSDGTTVILNAGTELRYPNTFAAGKREVLLSGEAFFMVKSDKENPFIVKTSDFDVKVTGTKFDVCSYDDDRSSSVTLNEGRVDVQFENETVNITPGHQIQLNKEERNYYIQKADTTIETAWKDGEFRFKEIVFPELIKKLERWYDIKLFYSAPELTTMLYSGNFKNQETIWQVLDALKLTTPIEYKKTGFREFEITYKPLE